MRKLKNILLLIFLLLFLLPGLLISQGSNEIEGDKYFEKAKEFFPENLDSTYHYCDLALGCFKKAESWSKYIHLRSILNTVHYTLGDYAEFQINCKETVKEAELYLSKKSPERLEALSNYAIYFREIGAFKKSTAYLNEVLDIENQLKDNSGLMITLGNLGTIATRKGDFGEALKYYTQVHVLSELNPGVLSLANKANNFNKLGNVFYEIEMLDTAKVYFRKSLDILSVINIDSNEIAQINLIKSHLCLAETYLKQNQSDSIKLHVEKALQLSKKYDYEDGGKAYEILGRYARRNKKYSIALKEFQKSRSRTIEKYESFQKHYLIAEKDILIAETYESNKQYQASLNAYQDALQMLSQEELSDDVLVNPNIKNINSRLNVLNALFGKSNTIYKLYQQDRDNQKLKSAFFTLQIAGQLILEIRKDYHQEDSRLQLSMKAMAVYELAIELALELNANTGDEKYLEEAFRFSESNKSVLLLESINENIAKGLSGIPAELLEKENDLRYGLVFFKRKLNEEKNKKQKGSENIISNYTKKLFELDQAYQKLIKLFETDYPKYHQLKYDTQLATLAETQMVLKDDDAVLIEYFMGVKNIYVFSVTRNNINVKKLEKNKSLLADIENIRTQISQPPVQNIKQNYYEYTKSATSVFNEILVEAIPFNAKQLIIISDDRLGYLPFEILLNGDPLTNEVSYSVDNLSYLFEDYEISYAYSATLLTKQITQVLEPAPKKIIGFAPSFNGSETEQRFCDDRSLYDLSCSQNEIEQVVKVFGGESLLKVEATKSSFVQKAAEFQIIHLATHACVDDNNPAFNKIYFADDYISNNDLYSLEFNSELIVLSACETGAGRLAKGEGVMSLARGFFNAGCPSVIMSLWSVDDCATAHLMESFYQNIAKGQSKSESLRQAKLSYLGVAKKAQQHPYYWAGFVQIGNYEPLSDAYRSTNLIYGILILVFVFTAFFYFSKK